MFHTLQKPINLLDFDFPRILTLVSELGWPTFRAKQILRWLYQNRIRTIQNMTNLSFHERSYLESNAIIGRFQDIQSFFATDGTQKFLFRLGNGKTVESVLIPDGQRLTLCLSTQVGCTLDCTFCLTGQMGLHANLKAHEIVDQVLSVQDTLHPEQHLTSLVFMGMGEPLANIEAVTDAVTRMTNTQWGMGFSPKRITLSTAGLATRLNDVASLGINLAISLNASTNEQRDILMPMVNRLHPLPTLLSACRKYPLRPGRRLTFEYVLLDNVNDSELDAKRLIQLLKGIHCKVNLIPFNEFTGNAFQRPTEARINQFQNILRHANLDAFVRRSRGRDILGACGQLGVLPSSLISIQSSLRP